MNRTGEIKICTDKIVGIFSERVFGDFRVANLITEHGEIVLGVNYRYKETEFDPVHSSALDRIELLINSQE